MKPLTETPAAEELLQEGESLLPLLNGVNSCLSGTQRKVSVTNKIKR